MTGECERREIGKLPGDVYAGARRKVLFYIVENVPARVDEETGEQFFSPATVERLQKAILWQEKPKRVVETPVYEYSE